jgi:hypothetical protein
MIIRGKNHQVCVGAEHYRRSHFSDQFDAEYDDTGVHISGDKRITRIIHDAHGQAELRIFYKASKVTKVTIQQCKERFNKNYDQRGPNAIAEAAVGLPIKDFIAKVVS